MTETFAAVRLTGLRLDSLGNYLAALGLMQASSAKWTNLRGLWSDGSFVVGATGLTGEVLSEFLLNEWKPTEYERWWKGAKDIARLRSWEPQLGRVKLLDAHLVSKGQSNVYNDILGTGGNVGKRDFAKVSGECRDLIRKAEARVWLDYALFGSPQNEKRAAELPDLPSTGTWFAAANKAFNSGYAVAREGQLSPWSFLLALEGATLLRGGVAKRLSARATRYATFPFVSEAAAPDTPGELGKERSEFWAPVWDHPASLAEVKALLRQGQARVGNRAARAPFDFAAAVLSRGAQAGLARFERFALRQTTSANTYEAIHSGTAEVVSDPGPGKLAVQVANWIDSLPKDKASTQKSAYYGLRAPVERALLNLAGPARAQPEKWRELLFAVGKTQLQLDRNRRWREQSRPISGLPMELFEAAWPGRLDPEIEIARSVASLAQPNERQGTGYGLRHNIFGLSQVRTGSPQKFSDAKPASTIWHDGDPVRLLADILERRLVDAEGQPESGKPVPPLLATHFCRVSALNRFAMRQIDPAAVTALLPSLSLLEWQKESETTEHLGKEAPSNEFLVQGYFRPLVLARSILLTKGANSIEPDAARARVLVKMIRAGMWSQAFHLSEQVYRSCGIEVVRAPDVSASGDWIAACLLIPVTASVTRTTFKWWMVARKKGKR